MTNVQRTYEKWWLGKYLEDGRQIRKVKFLGPPSGVYGQVVLTLDDGTEMNAPQGPKDFRPRKKNFEVFDENPIPPTGLEKLRANIMKQAKLIPSEDDVYWVKTPHVHAEISTLETELRKGINQIFVNAGINAIPDCDDDYLKTIRDGIFACLGIKPKRKV